MGNILLRITQTLQKKCESRDRMGGELTQLQRGRMMLDRATSSATINSGGAGYSLANSSARACPMPDARKKAPNRRGTARGKQTNRTRGVCNSKSIKWVAIDKRATQHKTYFLFRFFQQVKLAGTIKT
ncbi:MAG TPA: hypothetical protein VL424_08060 [Pararobbsia sp.]|jgi:hypothetical protein|nr:hypothetical protein [Pararobbsia sp.]